MKKEKTKKKKGFIKWILIILSALLGLSLLVGLASVGLSSLRERNPANLLTVDEGYIGDMVTLYGLTVDVDADGVIKFDGQSSGNDLFVVKRLTLDPGVYTISGINKVDVTKMDLYVTWGNGNIAQAGTSSATFELTEKTEVSVEIFVAASNDEVGKTIVWQNKTIKPVLVKGSLAGDFYA